jgi:hypothetical protein
MAEQMAVMRGVRYGTWGMHKAGVFFEAWLPDGSATLQLLFGKAAKQLLLQGGMSDSDVRALLAQPGNGGSYLGPLEGRFCRVEVDGDRVTFTGLVAAP